MTHYVAALIGYAHDNMVDIQTALDEKGLTPYIQTISDSTSITPPDASSYVETAFKAMFDIGKLD